MKTLTHRKFNSNMSKQSFDHIGFKVIEASRLEDLFGKLSNEPRPFELTVHPSIAGTRPITIRATNADDAQYFSKLLRDLAYEQDRVKQ